ncbi:thioredoxin [Halorussus litoreus]|uniref:thioredoxin n=1 Tax=Halorussus litoreus TaxID=1710536 RepID=UPI000E22BEBF|nr:thioredoxin [Halorussus litoreus]
MTDDQLEALREQKRQELLNEGAAGTGAEGGSDDAETGVSAAPDDPIHVESVEQFSTVTTDYDVVLVDFYADWCGPCKMIEPTVAAIAAETDAAVAKVDIDQHQGLAAQYGVRSVPTLLLFADGKQVEQIVGAQDESKLRSLVERYC